MRSLLKMVVTVCVVMCLTSCPEDGPLPDALLNGGLGNVDVAAAGEWEASPGAEDDRSAGRKDVREYMTDTYDIVLVDDDDWYLGMNYVPPKYDDGVTLTYAGEMCIPISAGRSACGALSALYDPDQDTLTLVVEDKGTFGATECYTIVFDDPALTSSYSTWFIVDDPERYWRPMVWLVKGTIGGHVAPAKGALPERSSADGALRKDPGRVKGMLRRVEQ